MYLFIFSVLLLIFQYVNSKNILDKYEEDIVKVKAKVADKEKKISLLEDKNFELNYFNIDRNEDALAYFEAQGYNTDELVPAILDGLYSMNNYEGEDHPIVPYVSMTDSKLLINKVRILNHKVSQPLVLQSFSYLLNTQTYQSDSQKPEVYDVSHQ